MLSLTKEQYEEWLKTPTINPITGRKINPHAKHGIASLIISSYKQPRLNDIDPITLESIEDLQDKDTVIVNGNHCYTIESLFDYYKSQVQQNLPIKDPLNPNYRLTKHELRRLFSKIKKKYPTTIIPKKPVLPDKNLYQLTYHEDFIDYKVDNSTKRLSFYHLFILKPGECAIDLGYVPSFVDVSTSGFSNVTSAVVLQQIFELWNVNRLIISFDPLSCSLVRRDIDYWINDSGFNMQGFNSLAYEIEQLL